MPARRVAAWAVITVVSLLHLASHAPWQRNAHLTARGDAAEYWRLMQEPWADDPFALRMLTPALVRSAHHATGFDPDVLWLALTFGATLAACIVFFELLRARLRLSMFMAVFGAVLLASTFWYAPHAFSNPWLADPLDNLLVVTAVWLLLRPLGARGLAAFTALVVVGAVNKETALLLMPLYPLLAYLRVRRVADPLVLASVEATLGAVAGHVAYRMWAAARVGGEHGPGSLFHEVRFSLADDGDQLALWTVFGALWLVCVFGLYRRYRDRGAADPLLVATVWIFGCCLAGRLVATDTQRAFVTMAPLVLAVVAIEFDRHRGETQRFWLLVLGVAYAAGQLSWIAPSVVADALVLTIVGGLLTAAAWSAKEAARRAAPEPVVPRSAPEVRRRVPSSVR